MMIIYVCPFTGQCGGTRIICEHVTRLADRGHVAEWWGLAPPPNWFGRRVPYRVFPSTDHLGDALRRTSAVKVATWWQTASWVAPNLQPGEAGFYLVQDLDQETYAFDHSGSSYKLGLIPIVESAWVAEQLRNRWNLSPINVSLGIDHDVFKPLNVPRDINRVFTTYRPASGPNDLKGFSTALRVVQIARNQNPAASLVTFGNQGFPRVPADIPHIHVATPSDEKLRELYSQAGAYLMTSRHEGFGLPAAEAMACGCPVVCTDAHGNAEFCRHDLTALVGDSPENLAAHVLAFQRDAALRERIAIDARRLVASRYQWGATIDRLEASFLLK